MSSRERDFECEEGVDAAAYVLGALAAPEHYREHLATCAACRAEVAGLQRVVDTLPTTVAPTIAPDALRQRILATVHAQAELLRSAGAESDRPAKRAGGWRPLRTAGFALAAGVAVAVAVALTPGSPAREQVTPGEVAATIHGARASLRQIGGRSELVVSGMPQAPLDRIYQVWLSRSRGSPEPTDALFSVTTRGNGSVDVPDSLRGVREVMVTSEPLGGSSHPTSPPLIRVTIRA